MREDYIHPVGPAREPSAERRRLLLRIMTAVLVIFIVWLLWSRVVQPPKDEPFRSDVGNELPAPV